MNESNVNKLLDNAASSVCRCCMANGCVDCAYYDDCSIAGNEDIDEYDCMEQLKQYWKMCLPKGENHMDNNNKIDHPSYYQGKIEVIDFIEDKHLGFNLGNCIKYISRCYLKHKDNPVEDLKKARWYLDREIKNLTRK